MSRFTSCHPSVSALYFISVLCITMFTSHPTLLLLSFVGAVMFFLMAEKRLRVSEISFYLVLFVLIALTNPLFSHNGITPLFFLNGNPITLEAVLYGVVLALMLIAVMFWFKCFNFVMSSDKLMFLFGKISPKIALLISSALRFIPLLKIQAEKIRQSQKAMGLYASDTWTDKLRSTLRAYSALITGSLENAIDTGSSMKGRGYGLKGRSHYSVFTFRRSDAVLLLVIAVLDAVIITVMAAGRLEFSFYPSISANPVTVQSLTAIIAFAVLSFLPFILEVKEDLQWKYYRSKI